MKAATHDAPACPRPARRGASPPAAGDGGGRRRLVFLFLGALAAAEPPASAAALRIVSLAPSVTETLFALGAGAEVVGVSTQCDYPPEAATIDRVGSYLEPNAELVLAKHPDLVIAAPSPGSAVVLEELQKLGVGVLVVDPSSVGENEQAITRIARAIGRADRGTTLVAAIRADISAIRKRLAGAAPRRVLLVLGQTPLVAAGRGGLPDELIRLAHGVNIAAGGVGPWPQLNVESVVAAEPEVIIDLTLPHERNPAARRLGIWQAFPSIPAVRNDRVHGYAAALLSRPGPRLAAALEQMARFIHPERFDGH